MHITNNDFYDTLNGVALDYARLRKNQMFYQNPILVGKIHGTFAGKNLLQYEAPQFGGDIDNLTKNLNTRTFKKSEINNYRYLKNPKMTTPYAGNGVGMLFPQDESHRVLLTPNGERDIALVGPAYFGPEDVVPIRTNAKDFRLQLPNWVLYIQEDGVMILEQDTQGTSLPIGSGTHIKFTALGDVEIDGITSIKIGGVTAQALSQALHTHKVGNMGIVIPPHTSEFSTLKLKGA